MHRERFLGALAALGVMVSGCRRGGDTMSDASPPSAADAASAASVAPAAPPPIVKSAAPKAPARSASLTCAATPADAKPLYERCTASVRDCTRRGGRCAPVEGGPPDRHPTSACYEDLCKKDGDCGPDRVCLCGGATDKLSTDHS